MKVFNVNMKTMRLFKVPRDKNMVYVYAIVNPDGSMGFPISPFFSSCDEAELFALALYDALYESTLTKDGEWAEHGAYEMFNNEAFEEEEADNDY